MRELGLSFLPACVCVDCCTGAYFQSPLARSPAGSSASPGLVVRPSRNSRDLELEALFGTPLPVLAASPLARKRRVTLGQRVRTLLLSPAYVLALAACVLYAMFGDDARLATAPKSADDAFYSLTVITLVVFVVDMALNAVASAVRAYAHGGVFSAITLARLYARTRCMTHVRVFTSGVPAHVRPALLHPARLLLLAGPGLPGVLAAGHRLAVARLDRLVRLEVTHGLSPCLTPSPPPPVNPQKQLRCALPHSVAHCT